jgi:hypothetical protein
MTNVSGWALARKSASVWENCVKGLRERERARERASERERERVRGKSTKGDGGEIDAAASEP